MLSQVGEKTFVRRLFSLYKGLNAIPELQNGNEKRREFSFGEHVDDGEMPILCYDSR